MKKGTIHLKDIYKEMVKRKIPSISYFEILSDITKELEIDAYELGLKIRKNHIFMKLLLSEGKEFNIIIFEKTKHFRLDRLFS